MGDNKEAAPETVQLPAEVLCFIRNVEPRFKDEPKAGNFCGRQSRLKGMMEIIHQTIDDKEASETPAGQIVIGAPGAGKTALIAELERKLTDDKVSVIRVKPSNIKTAKDFNNVILGQNPWKNVARMKAAGRTLAEIAKAPLDKAAGVGLTAALAHFGIPVALAEVPVFTTVVDHWLADREPRTGDVLELLQHGRRNGCVLIIDEAQDMNQFLGNDDYKSHMHEIIETLGIPSSRKGKGITKATIVIAGLSDTPRVVERSGSQGMTPRMLPPLPPAEVRQMVTKSIQSGAGNNKELAAAADARWGDAIAQQYGDWTRHAKAGALAIEDLLRKFGDRVVNEAWGTAAIAALGERYQNDMYDSIRRRTKQTSNDRGVGVPTIDLIGYALLCNRNLIGQAKLHSVIEQGLAGIESPNLYGKPGQESQLAAERDRVVQRMLHTGMLDRTDELPDDREKTLECYYCPIPSLLDHTGARLTTALTAMNGVLQDESLAWGEFTPAGERFQPTWWEDDDPSGSVPSN